MRQHIWPALAVILAYLSAQACFAWPWVWLQNKDLNRDGRTDHARLVLLDKKDSKYQLTVNGALIRDNFRGFTYLGGFEIVDIDRSDRYKEVAVHACGGAGDTHATAFYWYDGEHVHRTGTIVMCGEVQGNGWLTEGTDWDFWQQRTRYVLNRDHRLVFVPDRLYTVDKAGLSRHRFTLYRTRVHRQVVTEVRPCTWVRVLLCDCQGRQEEWNYLVRTDRGLRGWTHLKYDDIDLPRAA